jgi:glyoxylase-like metal-dependent hydrolase (beta-lactamase superfamily II)
MASGNGHYQGGELLNSLSALGVSASDITDVVFTHLHFDHVGWASREGAIVFPNATYRCDARDWAHFQDNERVQPILAPVLERLETWSASGPLCAGIDLMTAPGHTPGSTIMVLSSGTARALLLGDVVHCPVELIDDEWAGLGDVDADLAKKTKMRWRARSKAPRRPVAAAHFRHGVRAATATSRRRAWVI